MSFVTYEEHTLSDPDFPAIYHIGCIDKGFPVLAHWHENLELLYAIEGSAKIIMDGREIIASAGQLIINNSRCIHSVEALSDKFVYHCLIIGQSFCRAHGIKVKEDMFAPLCPGEAFKPILQAIHTEVTGSLPYYKTRVQSEILNLLVLICRNYLSKDNSIGTKSVKRLEAVKLCIGYILEHFTESLTTDELCKKIGYSKYYVCHAFKEATGLTPIEYINLQRCRYAAMLLSDENVSVSEAALRSGFNSSSYFSRTYKKCFGSTPSGKGK